MSINTMKLALEALELAGGNLCEALHHPKKLQHGIGEPCPAVAKYDEAIAALRQAIEQASENGLYREGYRNGYGFGEAAGLRQAIEQAQKQEKTSWTLEDVKKSWKSGYQAGLEQAQKQEPDYNETSDARLMEMPKQEPVTFLTNRRQRLNVEFNATGLALMPKSVDWKLPLYTFPPQRQWVGLTLDEQSDCYEKSGGNLSRFAKAIEAKLKEKNT